MEEYTIVFESENIYFVKVSIKLVDEYLKMINDFDVASKIFHEPKSYTYEEEVQWVEDSKKNNDVVFSMIEKNTKKFIGNIAIFSQKDGFGKIGITITKDMQHKHFGTESINALINYGKEEFGLVGYFLNVFKTNDIAYQCYKKIGFIPTGTGDTPEDIYMIYKIKDVKE